MRANTRSWCATTSCSPSTTARNCSAISICRRAWTRRRCWSACMAAQWEHALVTRTRDNIVEKFLGGAPMVNRKVYFDASPSSYVTVDKNTTRFLLLYGHEDDIADPKSQSERFLLALKQAGFFARTIVVPGAGHFWSV